MTEILIVIHAVLGGVALFAGLGALSAKKGGFLHRRSGAVFYYSMTGAALLAMIISLLPSHYNPFLFAIGVFSLYLLIGGKRSIRYIQPDHNFLIDKLISWSMLLTGIAMILTPVITAGRLNIILAVFGAVGVIFAWRDVRLYANPKRVSRMRIVLHLGKMCGGYIASLTAFLVVNDVLPTLANWFAPGVIGAIYIAWWTGRMSSKSA